MAGFLDAFKGTPQRNEQVPTLNQQQSGLQNQSIQQLLGLLQGTGGLEGFKPIEQQARQGFQQQTIPLLSERFANLGSGAGLSSPSFASQLGQAGAGLETNLAGLRSQYGQNQLQNLLPYSFKPSFENVIHARQPGFGEQAASGLASSAGPLLALLGLYLGIPGLGGGANKQQPEPNKFNQGSMDAFRSPASTYGYNTQLNFGQSPNINF